MPYNDLTYSLTIGEGVKSLVTQLAPLDASNRADKGSKPFPYCNYQIYK